MKSYRVSYERDQSGWWVASVRGIRGCHTQGTLPGGLNVTRRAHAINARLLPGMRYEPTLAQWVSLGVQTDTTLADAVDPRLRVTLGEPGGYAVFVADLGAAAPPVPSPGWPPRHRSWRARRARPSRT